ncbi:hypothetical protein V6R85_01215 [Agrobacterium sp. CCNWLW32]|uniref:hypothetical protein n=1 Tax=Agrobacterium sp. CCNWLW32 TaxID=3122072 RepID=UPI00300FB50C
MQSEKTWNLFPRIENAKTEWLKALRYAASTSASDRERIERVLIEREMQSFGGENGQR